VYLCLDFICDNAYNIANCAYIMFDQAVVQRNYEHIQKQERSNEILITDYVV